MASQEGLLSSKRGKTTDWSSSLKPSHTDTFSQDSGPVKEAREHYFTTHPWHWAHDNMDNLSDIFRELAQGAGLLGESIHEIQLAWNGLEDLKHANYVLQSLPKGLKFLMAVSTKESSKIMGLKGIHDSNALQHLTSYTYCPWCSKHGQNEGTIVNHLRTVHYKLGLICNQCFGCPTVMLDTSTDMGATLVLIKALSPKRAHSAGLNWSLPKEVKVMSFTRPPPLGRLESSTKKALTTIPSNQPCQQTNAFHPSHDKNYLTKMLLITTKVVFLEKQTNKTNSIFNFQQPRIR